MVVAILLFLVLVVGGVLLQIFLSTRKTKWFGLILPALCLLFSLFVVFGNMTFAMHGELTLQQIAPDGAVLHEESVEHHGRPTVSPGAFAVQAAAVFLLNNIPTAILLLIYFACRERVKKNTPLEKMNIQDLE